MRQALPQRKAAKQVAEQLQTLEGRTHPQHYLRYAAHVFLHFALKETDRPAEAAGHGERVLALLEAVLPRHHQDKGVFSQETAEVYERAAAGAAGPDAPAQRARAAGLRQAAREQFLVCNGPMHPNAAAP